MSFLIPLFGLACYLPALEAYTDTTPDEVAEEEVPTETCTTDTAWFSVQDPAGRFDAEGWLDVTVDVANLREDYMWYPGVVLTIDQPYDVSDQDWWWYGMIAGDVMPAPFSVDLRSFPKHALDEVLLTFEVTSLICSEENPEDCIEGCTLSCNVADLLANDCPVGTPSP